MTLLDHATRARVLRDDLVGVEQVRRVARPKCGEPWDRPEHVAGSETGSNPRPDDSLHRRGSLKSMPRRAQLVMMALTALGSAVLTLAGSPLASAGSVKWRLDPVALPGNAGIYRCTPRWAQQETGGRALCDGHRMIFRTPIIDPIQAVGITGFRHFAQGKRGVVDYRIHLDWNDESNAGYTTDRIRFVTSDGGRHWLPKTLRRQDANETKPPGGVGTKPATDKLLPVKPCIWRNYARRYPHHPSAAAFGNTCIPRATTLRFSL